MAKRKATRRSGGWKHRVYSAVKRPSVAMMVTVLAIVFTITGWMAAQRATFIAELNGALRQAGINQVVTGATLVLGVIAAVAICTFAPNAVGRPVNAFLGRWGLRL